jgi:hypothetical protein
MACELTRPPVAATKEKRSFVTIRIGSFYRKLRASREIYEVEIHAYVLMPNHASLTARNREGWPIEDHAGTTAGVYQLAAGGYQVLYLASAA